MGTGASASPAEQLVKKKRQTAMKFKTSETKPSDFYCACRDGDIEYVRTHIDNLSKEEIDKIEPNGDTALHAATRKEHKEIVQLLIQRQCSRIVMNKDGLMPHEEIKTEDMHNVYKRPTLTRFHEDNIQTSLDTFKPGDQEIVDQVVHDYVKSFENEKQLAEYSLKQQTTAMWLNFFSIVTSKFGKLLRRPDFKPELFDLEHDRDFNEFLRKAINDEKACEKTIDALKKAEKSKHIEPLITLYTSEFGNSQMAFYEILNKQLSIAAENNENTAHFCDRFLYEFEMKRDQLENRAHTGKTYRGVSLAKGQLKLYEDLSTPEKKGIIATRVFTSTSTSKDMALNFTYVRGNDQEGVLFVFNIATSCSGIISVKDVSEFPGEEEVLIIPGNLFRVQEVKKDREPVEIHLEHINTKVSAFRKIAYTITAARSKMHAGRALATDTK